MANIELAAQIATIFSAISAAAQFGISYQGALRRVERDRRTVMNQAKSLISTYSDTELESLHDRIKACRDRFIDEGDGKKRVQCMCSVLRDAIDGNGGTAPVPEWEEMFKNLCASN